MAPLTVAARAYGGGRGPAENRTWGHGTSHPDQINTDRPTDIRSGARSVKAALERDLTTKAIAIANMGMETVA